MCYVDRLKPRRTLTTRTTMTMDSRHRQPMSLPVREMIQPSHAQRARHLKTIQHRPTTTKTTRQTQLSPLIPSSRKNSIANFPANRTSTRTTGYNDCTRVPAVLFQFCHFQLLLFLCKTLCHARLHNDRYATIW